MDRPGAMCILPDFGDRVSLSVHNSKNSIRTRQLFLLEKTALIKLPIKIFMVHFLTKDFNALYIHQQIQHIVKFSE